MRIAVLILSLASMGVILFQSCAASIGGALSQATGGDAAKTEGLAQGGALGFLVALFYLIGAAFVIGVPIVSFVIFLIGGLVGLGAGATTAYSDLSVWGWVSLVLAVFSFFGWRGKKRQARQMPTAHS